MESVVSWVSKAKRDHVLSFYQFRGCFIRNDGSVINFSRITTGNLSYNKRKDFPMVRINRVYTRTGDDGTTGLAGGQRLSKAHPRIEAYGTVDELNAILGFALASLPEGGNPPLSFLKEQLLTIQNELFDLGAELAVLPEDRRPDTPAILEESVLRLEKEMDRMNGSLPRLSSFTLPGGSELSSRLHLARTVCRRAERAIVRLKEEGVDLRREVLRYINRLSDWLFVAARYVIHLQGVYEPLWEPGGKGKRSSPASSPP